MRRIARERQSRNYSWMNTQIKNLIVFIIIQWFRTFMLNYFKLLGIYFKNFFVEFRSFKHKLCTKLTQPGDG